MRSYEHVQVHIVDWLPLTVSGFTVMTSDNEDFYCIILNGKLGRNALVKSYEHEIQHIDNHDFDSMYTADQIESMRHAG
jgi:hypothetical protein